MRQFSAAGHLLSWAGLIPALLTRVPASGARRASERGTPWLKPVLVQCAWAVARKKNSYFEAQFLAAKSTLWPQKSCCRCRSLHPDHRLPHVGRRHWLPAISAPTISPAVIQHVLLPSSPTASAISDSTLRSGPPHDTTQGHSGFWIASQRPSATPPLAIAIPFIQFELANNSSGHRGFERRANITPAI